MSHEREPKEKSGKKVAAKNLMEKRAAKVAKREEKASGRIISINQFSKTEK